MALVKTILEGNKIEYDDSEFEIVTNCYTKEKYLHYIGDGINVTNPKGNTSCYCMFQNYEGTSIDLSNFDTHNITDMSFMFHSCMNLEHLSLSNFSTNKATDMEAMFCNCIKLKTLDISKFDTSNVMYMERMFRRCKSLKELDISSFCINDTKMLDDIFWDCKNLEKVKVSSNVSQFFANHKNYLFKNCNKLTIIPITEFDKAIENLFY